mgnify:CR=1 FL=1
MKTLETMALGVVTLGMLTFNSCKKEDPIADPTACFTVSGNLNVDESILFSNCSGNATEYLWYFGDGTNSESADPTHVYYNSGTYTVELYSYNEEGTSRSTTKTITIVDKVPVNMIVNEILLKRWPSSNNGVAWDNNSYPDILVRLGDANNWLTSESGYIMDCDPNTTKSYTSIFPYTYGAMNTPLEIHFYDYDVTSANDWMGGLQFTPSAEHYVGQTVITLSNSYWEFDVHVSWVY